MFKNNSICGGCGIECDPRESLCAKCHTDMMTDDAWQLKASESTKSHQDCMIHGRLIGEGVMTFD